MTCTAYERNAEGAVLLSYACGQRETSCRSNTYDGAGNLILSGRDTGCGPCGGPLGFCVDYGYEDLPLSE